EEQGRRGTSGGTEPVGAVDNEVDAAAHSGRDEFVDRGVHRRVLSTDAGTGEEADEEEVPGGEGERCGDRGHQIEDQGDDEQLAASEAVGELAEDDRADAGAEDVDRAGGADVGG